MEVYWSEEPSLTVSLYVTLPTLGKPYVGLAKPAISRVLSPIIGNYDDP